MNHNEDDKLYSKCHSIWWNSFRDMTRNKKFYWISTAYTFSIEPNLKNWYKKVIILQFQRHSCINLFSFLFASKYNNNLLHQLQIPPTVLLEKNKFDDGYLNFASKSLSKWKYFCILNCLQVIYIMQRFIKSCKLALF